MTFTWHLSGDLSFPVLKDDKNLQTQKVIISIFYKNLFANTKDQITNFLKLEEKRFLKKRKKRENPKRDDRKV